MELSRSLSYLMRRFSTQKCPLNLLCLITQYRCTYHPHTFVLENDFYIFTSIDSSCHFGTCICSDMLHRGSCYDYNCYFWLLSRQFDLSFVDQILIGGFTSNYYGNVFFSFFQAVVIEEVDSFLFRPHLGLRAKYHAVCSITCTTNN